MLFNRASWVVAAREPGNARNFALAAGPENSADANGYGRSSGKIICSDLK